MAKSKRKFTTSGRPRNLGWKKNYNKIIKRARQARQQTTKTASANPVATLAVGAIIGGLLVGSLGNQ